MLILALLWMVVGCHSTEPRWPERVDPTFTRYCADCHGYDARGDGLLKPYIKGSPPDLTLIAARHAGHFPDAEVWAIIDGQGSDDFVVHRHMPVWGYEFFGDQSDDRQAHAAANDRIARLVDYLKSLQRGYPVDYFPDSAR